jgi:hypothetical protein
MSDDLGEEIFVGFVTVIMGILSIICVYIYVLTIIKSKDRHAFNCKSPWLLTLITMTLFLLGVVGSWVSNVQLMASGFDTENLMKDDPGGAIAIPAYMLGLILMLTVFLFRLVFVLKGTPLSYPQSIIRALYIFDFIIILEVLVVLFCYETQLRPAYSIWYFIVTAMMIMIVTLATTEVVLFSKKFNQIREATELMDDSNLNMHESRQLLEVQLRLTVCATVGLISSFFTIPFYVLMEVIIFAFDLEIFGLASNRMSVFCDCTFGFVCIAFTQSCNNLLFQKSCKSCICCVISCLYHCPCTCCCGDCTDTSNKSKELSSTNSGPSQVSQPTASL